MKSRHAISSRGWIILFALTLLLLAGLLAGFNVVTDPFGAFGDRFFHWWSYDETNNPRVAKLQYLEQHHDEYDSYIVGCSGTSSYPTEQLNEYFDANFYNLIVYGADMLDTEQFCRYLIENYTVENLVLNVYLGNGFTYDTESDPLTYSMPYQADGSSALDYYRKYLFANPKYGWAKIQSLRQDTYLQQAFDVFDEKTGAYDKQRRDIEPIGDLQDYLQAYPVFADYPQASYNLSQTENCMKSVQAICQMCEEAGVNLVVVASPLYQDYADYFPQDQVEHFYTELAEITPYWDFSLSSVSRDPRYFYDSTHFRNAVGKMALARIAGDDSAYIPDDFGVYVTKDNVAEHLKSYWNWTEPDPATYTDQVPILMYHHLAEEGDGADTISVELFRAHMQALHEAGYTAVSFQDLYRYVNYGEELPEKPVVITFDDGYTSNYTLAYPILKEYGMQATIFVIGVSVGKDTYKDTGEAMTPHFSLEQAAEMQQSGLISIQSHGYDFHEVAGRDPEPIRQGVLQKADETEEEYIAFLREDYETSNALLMEGIGTPVEVVAYPYGYSSELSEAIFAEMGVYATVTTHPGTNTLIKGLPQCLRQMNRYGITENVTVEQLLELVQTEAE